jgi:hypothetical protein
LVFVEGVVFLGVAGERMDEARGGKDAEEKIELFLLA